MLLLFDVVMYALGGILSRDKHHFSHNIRTEYYRRKNVSSVFHTLDQRQSLQETFFEAQQQQHKYREYKDPHKASQTRNYY